MFHSRIYDNDPLLYNRSVLLRRSGEKLVPYLTGKACKCSNTQEENVCGLIRIRSRNFITRAQSLRIISTRQALTQKVLGYLVIYPLGLVNIDVGVSDAIRPTAAHRRATVDEVRCPKYSLSHMLRERCTCWAPQLLLVKAVLNTQPARQTRCVVRCVGHVSMYEIERLQPHVSSGESRGGPAASYFKDQKLNEMKVPASADPSLPYDLVCD